MGFLWSFVTSFFYVDIFVSFSSSKYHQAVFLPQTEYTRARKFHIQQVKLYVLIAVNTSFCVGMLHVKCLLHVSALWLPSGIVHSLLCGLLFLYISGCLHLVYCIMGFFTLRCNAPNHFH
jgi:hypothetical protein